MNIFIITSRILGVFAGIIFLIGSVIDYNITWTRAAFIAIFGILLVLPWRHIHNRLLWWTIFLALTAFDVSLLGIYVLDPASFIHEWLVNTLWICVLLAQLPAIWMIGKTELTSHSKAAL